MALRNLIMWTFLPVIVVLVMSTGVQAQELEEVPASYILEQIENGGDIHLENVRISGELNLSTIELETVPSTRTGLEIKFLGLEEELKIVESKIAITNSVFEDDVDFSNTLFGKDLDFAGTAFSGNTYFRWASFGGDAYFIDANFSGDAYFGSASFGGNASFTGASFSCDASFADASFNGSVNLNRCDYKRMEVNNWSVLKDALVFDGPTYVKLIKSFREMEQFDDADAAYFQYRRLSQANKKWSLSKLGEIFMWVSCGYGVKPHYTLGLGVALILVFALIYWQGNGIRRLKESGEASSRVSFGDAFYFSMVTFTTVGYGDWYPTDKYRKFVVIEGLLGWLTLALFLVTLANVMIRP